MAGMVYCESCQTVVSADEKKWPWPLDADFWALARVLKFPCPGCGKEGNFKGQRAETLEELKEIAKKMNLVWDPSPEFGKIRDRDYIQAIRNLSEERRIKWPNLVQKNLSG